MTSKTKDPVFGDWFSDPAPERNPMKLAQSAMRPPLPARFYETVSILADAGHYYLLLDGKKAHTPGRKPIALPGEAAADLIAAEWRAQDKVIDPATMHATRIVNSAIDRVGLRLPEVAREIAAYGKSDLLCYRAEGPEGLVERQRLCWDPMLDWARQQFGVQFSLAAGVMFHQQPAETIAEVERRVFMIENPIALAATHTITTLSGSVILALALLDGRLPAEAAFDASELEADFTAGIWGVDMEAAGHRTRRRSEFMTAAALLLALGYPVSFSDQGA